MTGPLSRRQLMGGAAMAGLGAIIGSAAVPATAAAHLLPISDAEWRERLTPMQYYVLRRAGTERPHSHPLHAERRPGRYLCAGCDAPLFSAAAKLDYGTGWPSFSVALSGAVRIGSDDALGYPRHEVRCAHCDGHLGHRLTDASTPSGRRYSMNGAGLRFVPTKAAG